MQANWIIVRKGKCMLKIKQTPLLIHDKLRKNILSKKLVVICLQQFVSAELKLEAK